MADQNTPAVPPPPPADQVPQGRVDRLSRCLNVATSAALVLAAVPLALLALFTAGMVVMFGGGGSDALVVVLYVVVPLAVVVGGAGFALRAALLARVKDRAHRTSVSPEQPRRNSAAGLLQVAVITIAAFVFAPFVL